jgi:small-conductance mechanosensitive channel
MHWYTEPFLTLGRTPVSLLTVVTFLVAVIVVVLVSSAVGRLIGSRLLARTAIDRGLQYAIGRMVYYALLVLGLMVALQTSGIEIGSLAVLLGALGVGIGFGLQNMVGNFVSGLILLAERPAQIGDWIEVGGRQGRVERIGARSTTIVTTDNISIIVPNGDLVTNQIINWSHGDPRVRFRVPVGVAYGSDMDRVRDALLAVAVAHRGVLADPPPTVLFTAFGDSSLNLELAVWTSTMVTQPLRFRSELNFAIDDAFRRAGVQVPFPQRDLHFRSGAVRLAESGRA